jgi:hypothetical protein
MRKFFSFLFTIAIFSSLIAISSCSEKEPTVGNLHVIVVDTSGSPGPSTQVYLTTSSDNQKWRIYQDSAWTDATGQVNFDDLKPGFYWYSAKGWSDYGAVKVYAGEDMRVYLWLNSHM